MNKENVFQTIVISEELYENLKKEYEGTEYKKANCLSFGEFTGKMVAESFYRLKR